MLYIIFTEFQQQKNILLFYLTCLVSQLLLGQSYQYKYGFITND